MCSISSSAIASPARPLNDLMECVEQCLVQVSEQALSWTENQKVDTSIAPSKNDISALLPMVSDLRSFHIAIAATNASCDLITRALLLIEDGEELPDDFDTSDALSEVVNIIAGEVKRALHDQDDSLKLGIPVVLQGPATVKCAEGQELAVSEYKIGPAFLQITILYGYINSKGKR